MPLHITCNVIYVYCAVSSTYYISDCIQVGRLIITIKSKKTEEDEEEKEDQNKKKMT